MAKKIKAKIVIDENGVSRVVEVHEKKVKKSETTNTSKPEIEAKDNTSPFVTKTGHVLATASKQETKVEVGSSITDMVVKNDPGHFSAKPKPTSLAEEVARDESHDAAIKNIDVKHEAARLKAEKKAAKTAKKIETKTVVAKAKVEKAKAKVEKAKVAKDEAEVAKVKVEKAEAKVVKAEAKVEKAEAKVVMAANPNTEPTKVVKAVKEVPKKIKKIVKKITPTINKDKGKDIVNKSMDEKDNELKADAATTKEVKVDAMNSNADKETEKAKAKEIAALKAKEKEEESLKQKAKLEKQKQTGEMEKTLNKSFSKKVEEFSEDKIDPMMIAKFKGTPAWEKIYALEKRKYYHWNWKKEEKNFKDAGLNTKNAEVNEDGKIEIKTPNKGFRLHSLTFMAILLVAAIVMTWFIKGGYLDANNNWEYVAQDTSKLSFADIFRKFGLGFQNRINQIMILIAISAYMGIMLRTNAIQAFADRLYKRWGNRRGLIIGIFIAVAVLSSITYSTWTIFALAAIIIPFVVALGYTFGVGFYIVMVGLGIGVMGGTLNTAATGSAINGLNASGGAGTILITMLDGILIRIGIFVVLTLAGIYGLLHIERRTAGDSRGYIFKKEHDKYVSRNQTIYSLKEATVLTKRHIVILISFLVMIGVIMLGTIPWHQFGINNFIYFSDWLWSNDITKVIYGTGNALGNWGYRESTSIVIFFTLVIALISKMSQWKIIQGVTRGINSISSVIIFMIIAGAVINILTSTGIHYTVLHSLSTQGSEALQVITVFFKSALTYLFIPFESDSIKMVSEVASTSALIVNGTPAFIVLFHSAIAMGAGVMIILSPTSPVLFGALSMGGISWRKWYTSVVPKVLIIAASGLALLVIGTFLV